MPEPKPPDADAHLHLARLPHGRHGLSREFVATNQRARITAATIATVAAAGFRDTSAADIAAAARVSRETFYACFPDKEACFLDTYGLIADHLLALLAAVAPAPWPERLRAQLAAILEAFAANPDLARFALIWPLAAPAEIEDRYQRLLTELIAALADGAAGPDLRPVSEPAEQALIAGLASAIAARVKAGEGERLLDLLDDLQEAVLAAYLGRAAARRLLSEAS